MSKVKCRMCSNFEDGFCSAKKSGGKHPKVRGNKYRFCEKFAVDTDALSKEIDREYKASKIPLYAPTWRWYTDEYGNKKELKGTEDEKGPRYVRINPNV